MFDELVGLVDPGVEPYKPKKGHPNVIMAVGLQVSPSERMTEGTRLEPQALVNRVTGRQLLVPNLPFTTRNEVSSRVSSVRIPSVRVPSTKLDRVQLKPRLRTLDHIPKQILWPSPLRV